MKPRHLIAATLISVLTIGQSFSEATPWYNDVEDDHVYHDAVWFMTQRDYVQGYTDGTFRPLNDVTRVEALKMILSSVETLPDETIEYELTFPDIDEDAWYMEYLEDALAHGIVSGHDDGFFRPEDTINRAEALKMLTIANSIDLEDVEGDWYLEYLNFGIDNAILVPVSSAYFQPDATLSRGELSDIIYRYIKDPYTGEVEFGKATYYADQFVGGHTANGEVYSHDELTAAHLTLPFGTMVRVTNLRTDLTVDVRINDRGPYANGYKIDLSESAFDTIGALSTGVLDVRIEVLSNE